MTALGQDDLIAIARRLPWRTVVELLRDGVERCHRPRELPQVVLDWFDLNRRKPGRDEEAVAGREELEVFRARMEEFGEAVGPAFRENFERAPIGPWWVEMRHYLRDGARWWLLRAHREDRLDVLASSRSDLGLLRGVVDYAGGVGRHPLVDAGESLIWTWRAR